MVQAAPIPETNSRPATSPKGRLPGPRTTLTRPASRTGTRDRTTRGTTSRSRPARARDGGGAEGGEAEPLPPGRGHQPGDHQTTHDDPERIGGQQEAERGRSL